MSLYAIALFAHILGAVLVFVLLTIEGLGLRFGFQYARLNQVFGPISAVLILVPGLYMMATQWGWTGWIVTGITAWVVIAVLGAYTGIGVARGTLSAGTVTVTWLARVGLALGVVFDMTVKPSLPIAVAAALVGVIVGAGLGLGVRREVRTT